MLEAIGTYSYRLNTPLGIYNVFYADLLYTAATDPLDSQVLNDVQLEPIRVDGEDEYSVEEI